MSTFAVLLVCIQACLLQSVMSCPPAVTPVAAAIIPAAAPCGYTGITNPGAYQYGLAGPYGLTGPYGMAGPYGFSGSPYDGIPGSAYPGAYGGSGEGNVAVAGSLPVSGNTAVAGLVPIMGAVGFSGPVAAAGAVSISGRCACGCDNPYSYYY